MFIKNKLKSIIRRQVVIEGDYNVQAESIRISDFTVDSVGKPGVIKISPNFKVKESKRNLFIVFNSDFTDIGEVSGNLIIPSGSEDVAPSFYLRPIKKFDETKLDYLLDIYVGMLPGDYTK